MSTIGDNSEAKGKNVAVENNSCLIPINPSSGPSLESGFESQIKLVEELFLDGESKAEVDINMSKKPKNKSQTNNSKSDTSKQKQPNVNVAADQKNRIENNTAKQPPKEKYMVTHRSRVYKFNGESGAMDSKAIPKDEKQRLVPSLPTLAPTIPPSGLCEDPLTGDNEEEIRSAMLKSWYNAGYLTGYYDALRRYKPE